MLQLILEDTNGRLPTSEFVLLVEDQNVGWLQLRHVPSKGARMPDGSETHIAYSIDEPYRRRGYGKEILRLGLIEARAIGLREVFIGADVSNVASVKIIEANWKHAGFVSFQKTQNSTAAKARGKFP
jgi:predicted acetyltransferase